MKAKKEHKKEHKEKKTIRMKKKTISLLILFIAIPVLAFSTYEVVTYFIDSHKTKSQINSLTDAGNPTETEDSDNTQIIEAPDEKPNTPYWNYIKMNLIDVDFTELKQTNSDVAAWLQVGGTNINYPVVQTTDNDFYLTHAFDKSANKAGWLFMDYRNDKNEYGKNTIIYAHNMKDQTMFGSLKKTLTKDWFNNADNRVIKMSSEKYNTLWQIFSIYTFETNNDYIHTVFPTDADYQAFLDLIKGRSYTNFNTSVTTNDRVLTLSTCHGNTKKLVVHAKLIKIEAR